MPKKTRNRRPKPPLELSGATLDFWQATPDLVEWAQREPKFRTLLTVLINERIRALEHDPRLASESLRMGAVLGYEEAIKVIQALAQLAPKDPPSEPDLTYPIDIEKGNVYET